MFVMCVIRHPVTSSLIRHKRKHSGEHLYHCEVCNKVFNQQSSQIRYLQLRSDGCSMFLMCVIRHTVTRTV